jgi:futalosine hydrolase
MEGAAVVHAANRVGAPAIEVRAISNTTGNRNTQEWDIPLALQNLDAAIEKSINALWNE